MSEMDPRLTEKVTAEEWEMIKEKMQHMELTDAILTTLLLTYLEGFFSMSDKNLSSAQKKLAEVAGEVLK